jgi:AraC-like DNA-binding protein
MRGRRRAAELRSNPGEFVGVLMVHHGTEILVQQGMTAEVTAGTAALWDGVRPVDCATMGPLVKHTMFVPRELLARALPDLDSVLVRTLPASVNLQLLKGWLNVARDQRELDAEAARTAERMAVDLLTSAIDLARDDTSGTQAVLRQRVKAYLNENLGDPDLTLDVVARANAISLRYLHLLFQDTGETAREYLRGRRLERAHDVLHGHGAEVSVAEIARRCGFDSPSSFSRAYRSRYGQSPREARNETPLAV